MKIATLLVAAVVVMMSGTARADFPVFSPDQFRDLSRAEQIEVISAYRDFIQRMESTNPKWFASAAVDSGPRWADVAALFLSLSEPANAEEPVDFDCFHAGWPNVRQNGKCPRPGTGKGAAMFKELMGDKKCAAGQTACNPIFFGEDLCFDPTKPFKDSGGNSVQGPSYAWLGCSQLSKGKYTLDQIVDNVLGNPKYLDAFHGIQDAAKKACGGDSPSGMCRALGHKLAQMAAKITGHTDSTYDCYNGAFQLWENELPAVTKPTAADWKAESDIVPAMNSCAKYKDGKDAEHVWCRGLPPGYIASVDPAKGQLVITKLKKIGKDDKDPVGSTVIQLADTDKSNHYLNELTKRLNQSREDFDKGLASGRPLGFPDAEKINVGAITGILSSLGSDSACKDTKTVKNCTDIIDTCNKLSQVDVHNAIKDACKNAPLNLTQTCQKIVGTVQPAPLAPGSSGGANAKPAGGT